MNWFERLFRKERANSVIAINELGKASHPERNYENFAKEGYKANPTAYRCINLIADAVSEMPLLLFEQRGRTRKKEILEHPVFDLLDRPNPAMSGSEFFRAYMSYLLISGNGFLQGVKTSVKPYPKELWPLRSDRMVINKGPFGLPSSYVYKVGQQEKKFPVDPMTGDSEILQMKTFNPLDDWWGMSPIEAAAFSIDQLNELGKWNLALIQNGARPSGAFVINATTGNPKAKLDAEQRSFLKNQLESQYSGSRRAGKMMLLEGGMDYKEMSLGPKDMEFIESRKISAVDVAMIFGVPPQLVGIQGHDTYANWKEARLAFYTDTVIPWAKFILSGLNHWLLPSFNESDRTRLYLCVDEDSVDALAPAREKRWENAMQANWLSTNEKREMTGYGKYQSTDDPADAILVGAGQVPLEYAAESPDLQIDEPEIDAEDFDPSDDDDNDDKPPEDETSVPKDEDEEEGKRLPYDVSVINRKAINVGTRAGRQRYVALQARKRRAYEKQFEVQVRAAFRQQQKFVVDSVKNSSIQTAELVAEEAIRATRKEFQAIYEKQLRRIMAAFGDDVINLRKYSRSGYEKKSQDDRFQQLVNAFIAEHVGTQITNIEKTTKKRVLKEIREAIQDHMNQGSTLTDLAQELVLPAGELNEETLAKAVESGFDKFIKNRAFTIARTETHNAANVAKRQAAEALQMPEIKKEWASSIDHRSRGAGPNDSTNHIAMDGTRVEQHEKFLVPSSDGIDEMDGPGDPTAPADQIINCRCETVFFVPEEEGGETE